MKEQMVIVIILDKNWHEHFVICPDMETAKRLYPSAEKRLATVKR